MRKPQSKLLHVKGMARSHVPKAKLPTTEGFGGVRLHNFNNPPSSTSNHDGVQTRPTRGPKCVSSLPVPQLQELKSQLDRELEHLTTSFQSLRTAQSKFRDCLKSISQGVNEGTAGKPLLIPLTSSLYVPGRLTSSTHVLIDIGTGFFVEKNTDDATDFYNRKVKDLGDSLKDLEQVINGKANNVRVVEEVIRAKVLNAQEQGAREGGKKAG